VAEFLLCLILLAVGGLVWSLRDATNPAVLWTWGWLVIGAVSASSLTLGFIAIVFGAPRGIFSSTTLLDITTRCFAIRFS